MLVTTSFTTCLRRAARGGLAVAVLVAAAFNGAGRPASATVVFSSSGTSVNPISAQASFTFSGNNLDITLVNTSTVATRFPGDVLTSLYFDILSGTARPNLQYLGASGRVFQVKSGTADVPLVYTPPITSGTAFKTGTTASNLKAWSSGDSTWQYKPMNSGSAPFLGFGVGTVGNSTSGTTGLVWSPNNFEAQVVGQLDFGIYAGEATTLQNQLEDRYLVSGSATFRFLVLGSGSTTFSEANLVPHVAFGFGTSPDAILRAPEPGGLAVCGLLGLAVLGGFARGRTSRGLWLACGFASLVVVVLSLPAGWIEPLRGHDHSEELQSMADDPPVVTAAAEWGAVRSEDA